MGDSLTLLAPCDMPPLHQFGFRTLSYFKSGLGLLEVDDSLNLVDRIQQRIALRAGYNESERLRPVMWSGIR
jgi:hypothetical protein